MRDLYHYYHVYCETDTWEPIITEHFEVLESSGLLSQLIEPVNIGLIGRPSQRSKVHHWLNKHLYSYNVAAADEVGFEQATLQRMWWHSVGSFSGGQSGVLYCHTKGSAHPSLRQDQWRHDMTKMLVQDWDKCVQYLEFSDVVGAYHIVNDGEAQAAFGDGADEVAAQLNKDIGTDLEVGPVFPEVGQAIFAGNFFWTTMAWIRSLPKPPIKSRYDAETWIGGLNRDGFEPSIFNVKAWTP